MSVDTNKSRSTANEPLLGFVTTDLLLSLATLPLLAGLTAQKAISSTAQEIGQLSEEVFRGDRLPILDFPPPKDIGADG